MAWERPERLLSVGSIVADIRVDIPHLPSRGGDVLGSTASVNAGGGFNILAAAARNGLPCAFGGRHGTGPHGTKIRADLARERIAALLPPCPEGDSGFCVVMVEPDGERTFVTSPGVESQTGEPGLASLEMKVSDALFVSGYDLTYPGLGNAIARCAQALAPAAVLVLDPGPLVAGIPFDILDAVLPRTRMLTMNRREAVLFAGTDDPERVAGIALPRLAPDALLILRDGAEGCVLAGARLPGRSVRIAAPQVPMLDSTGAGDTHSGVFVAAVAAGLDPISAAQRANAAAAISVTRRGPATAPATEELDAFLDRGSNAPDHRRGYD
jgi:sugar/nucleoside kinase (ribokinase family)